MKFVWAKWYKCDLHVHTTASPCFQNQEVTAEQRVDRAIESWLDCIAVTDHNSWLGIDAIQQAVDWKPLVVFPWVEITCDSSKCHLLVLFDSIDWADKISDFLVKCEIKREDFWLESTHSILGATEVATIANKMWAIVIPAHVDQFSGLDGFWDAQIDDLYNLPFINAVQVVHKEFLIDAIPTDERVWLANHIHEMYFNEAIDIMKRHKPVKKALDVWLAITTFSDNPHEIWNPKHWLSGIWTRYTYIKMWDTPTLEWLRQAFLMPTQRICNDFDWIPPQLPFWRINSIRVDNTEITNSDEPLVINFNPQLNTIIWWRWSWKSSILKFIRWWFNRTEQINLPWLEQILSEHNQFYKQFNTSENKWVLNEDSELTIEYCRDGVEFKLHIENIIDSWNQSQKLYRYDADIGDWIEETLGFVELFKYDHFSQKQIYEIAQEPNVLMDRIDSDIQEVSVLKDKLEWLASEYADISKRINDIWKDIEKKDSIVVEIRDYNSQIRKFTSSWLSWLMENEQEFTKEKIIITDFSEWLKAKEQLIQSIIETYDLTEFDVEIVREQYRDAVKSNVDNVLKEHIWFIGRLKKLHQDVKKSNEIFYAWINSSQRWLDFSENSKALQEKKEESWWAHIWNISSFKEILEQKTKKESELKFIKRVEIELWVLIIEADRIKDEYLATRKLITSERVKYVNENMNDDKIKVKINPFRNKDDFEKSLRKIIQRGTSFESSVNSLIALCFDGHVETKIVEFRKVFEKILAWEHVPFVDWHFIKLVKWFNHEQFDNIELLYPEDDITIKYKPNNAWPWKPLSSASAWQKTTAILTIILSQGEYPLILDQPEDDLDSRLVYDLIVDRLKQAKNNRQIIVVTHNANIPVNWDAEYVVSMNSESSFIEVLHKWTIEDVTIKREICDVMEWSKEAFEMRSKKYKDL